MSAEKYGSGTDWLRIPPQNSADVRIVRISFVRHPKTALRLLLASDTRNTGGGIVRHRAKGAVLPDTRPYARSVRRASRSLAAALSSDARLRLLMVVGTRPEAVKMAPVLLAAARHPELDAKLCVTGQHREMLDQVLSHFELTPAFDLNLMRKAQGLGYITGAVLEGLEPALKTFQPDRAATDPTPLPGLRPMPSVRATDQRTPGRRGALSRRR